MKIILKPDNKLKNNQSNNNNCLANSKSKNQIQAQISQILLDTLNKFYIINKFYMEIRSLD